MVDRSRLSPPMFEIGPKAYLVGDEVIELAHAADSAAARHDVRVIFTAPLASLADVTKSTTHLLVCAPHMDPITPGRGLTEVLPEALVAAGAHGVMLNHAERPITFAVLEKTMQRAREVGLFTVVCASSIAEIRAVALLGPDVLVAEPTELIGSGSTSDLSYMEASTEAVRAINPSILILHAAGISNGHDVQRVMLAGADATGSSSAIALAADRVAMVDEMVAAARRGWDARQWENTTRKVLA